MQSLLEASSIESLTIPHVDVKYRAYTLNNFRELPQAAKLSERQLQAIETVGQVLPFKTNNYVVNELIDWSRVPDDPMFILNFPQRDMLKPEHYVQMERALQNNDAWQQHKLVANSIRMQLNPHPAGQLKHNVPTLNGRRLHGIQHKYDETVLFFPGQGQTCHAYCSFCFRWPQFVGIHDLKFAARQVDELIAYLDQNPQVTDILFTGGDPLIMRANTLAKYLTPLLEYDHPSLQNIRIGSKSLSYWPYRFLTDYDADDLLNLFRKATQYGKHLALMAHFNHPCELKTSAVRYAIERIQETGAQIRTQSPLLAHINDDPALWAEMWREQVRLGCIPYYMFVVRDTGAQHYFGVSLERAWKIFRQAYQQVSGLGRSVRGPVMSAHPGKTQLLGVETVNDKKVFVLRMLQGRESDWVLRPFFAEYDENAQWFTDLKPAFGAEKFFFE